MAIVDIAQAVLKLLNGEAVAIPTETVYGLAARIDQDAALRSVFALKRRPFFDPLIVHVENVEQARSLTREWPEIYDLLAAKFWPGPLTLLAPKSDAVSPLITSGLESVGLRAPAHPGAREILEKLKVPLAAPSANLFGKTSPTTAAHVESEFAQQVAVVDGGTCAVGVESTVLEAKRLGTTWALKILRPGGISREQLREALRGVDYTLERASSAASPGSLKTHYQPRSPLIILNDKPWSDLIQLEVVKRLGRPVLGRSELKLPAEPQAAARVLYSELRANSLDEKHVLWIQRTPQQRSEDWEVVWDRLERASSLTL